MSSVPLSSRDQPADLLHREMRVRFGPVPAPPQSPLLDNGSFVLGDEGFQFVTDAGVRFHYARGQGITADVPAGAEDDYRLYLWGTVFGAVAWLNDYFPLHASAVAFKGRAIAFTGDSGAGKSTLAAGLVACGMPHICDDTLPLRLAGGSILAVPDRKPLKLWGDALELLGMNADQAIESMPGKFYARPQNSVQDAVPLGHLIVLEEAEQVSLEPIRGTAALGVFTEAMYRDFIPAHRGDGLGHAAWLLELVNRISVWSLRRPRSQPDRFPAQLAELRQLIQAACLSRTSAC